MVFDWQYIWRMIPDIASGLGSTILISLSGVFVGLVIGLLFGVVRTLRIPVFASIVAGFVEVVRNTPFLAQLFFLYFGLPTVGIVLPIYLLGTLALGAWTAAYSCENFRAGLEAVPSRFIEAGEALALNNREILRTIIFPVGLRISLPSLGNTIIETTKTTAFLSLIGYTEITLVSVMAISSSFKVVEMFTVLFVAYVGIVFGLSAILRFAERRLAIGVKL